MQPKVSIIVPCYGVEKYLDRCMDSLVNQTLRDIEIILVDDVSPDRVPEMCDEWAKKDSRIKVIHKEKNGGLGYARNTGLEVATGEYVAFVDSDDYVEKNAYQIYYNYSEGGYIDIVSAGIWQEDKTGVWRELKASNALLKLDKKQAWTYAKDMVASLPGEKEERKNNMSVWHAIYKRSLIMSNNIRFMSEREVNSEDLPFQLDFFKKISNAVIIPECLYHYCLNGNSLTTTFKEVKFNRYIVMRSLLLDKMSADTDRFDRANRFFIGYARSFTLHLMNSNRRDKNDMLCKILQHPIWKELSSQYKPSNLPPYQAVLYWMQIKGMKKCIFPYLRFMQRMKKSR